MDTYNDNTTRERIERAIMELSPRVSLDSNTTFDDVRIIIRVFMRQHPEIFWFSHQYFFDEKSGILKFKYNFTKDKAEFFTGEIDKVIKYDFQVDYVKTLSELERVVYVYKWIANRTTYNEYSSYNQTIFSVLINRNSVCAGYAKTAQYLLGLVGIESQLVFGKFHSDKSCHGRHVWNIDKINGKWYHVDFCLSDPSFICLLNNEDKAIEKESILWNYFGVTTDDIRQNRSIDFIETLHMCEDRVSEIPEVEILKPKKRLICCKSDSGSSAKVYLDSFIKDKVIKVSRNDNSDLLQREARVLSLLTDCPHIVKSFGLNFYGLELEQLTPWSELLNSNYYNPTESDLRSILRQLIEGLIECRDRGVTYSDIHYNNVFVTEKGVYKWGDFGIAYPLQSDSKLPAEMIGEDGKPKGSYWFMAPETYLRGVFTESSAIYSVAMMAYFVMNDMRPPFWSDEAHQQEALAQRLNGKDIPAPLFVDRYSDLWPLIHKVLSRSIVSRPRVFEDFLNWLDSNVIVFNEAISGAIEVGCYQNYAIVNEDNLFIDVDNDGCVDDSFAETRKIEIDDTVCVDDSDSFASTMGGRWGDGGIHDINSFACTAALPGNFVQQHYEHGDSYQPQKRSPVRAVRKYQSIKLDVFRYWNNNTQESQYDTELDYGNEINACVFAPALIQPMKTFIVRVYLYKADETETVVSKVKDIDPKTRRKEYKPLDIPVKEGDKLTVRLKMTDGVTLDSDLKTIIWRNHFTDCSFMAKLTDSSIDDVFGTAYISVNGIPAGELLFTIDVIETQTKNIYAKVESRRYSRIFISYSHADEVQVRGFAECCRALGTDYFFDRHTLQAGDVFKEKILEYIDNADLFVLCWSKNAAESEWVQIERKHALKLIESGNHQLAIYPLSMPPEAPLPPDMSDKYNFATL